MRANQYLAYICLFVHMRKAMHILDKDVFQALLPNLTHGMEENELYQ